MTSLKYWYGVKSFELYARLHGHTFRVARSSADLDAVYHIRWQVYQERGYILPRAYPQQRMTDRYDAWSVNLLGCYRGKPVGTLRLTPLDKGSPILDLFRVQAWPEPAETMEIGRFAVLPEARRDRIAALGLLGKMTEYSLRRRVKWWVGYTPRPLLRLFRGLFRYEEVPRLPPGERERTARQAMAGYFERHARRLVVFRIRVSCVTSWEWRKLVQ